MQANYTVGRTPVAETTATRKARLSARV